MADYTAKARTNYFRVKDLNAFVEDIEHHGLSLGEDGMFFADMELVHHPVHAEMLALLCNTDWPGLDDDSVNTRIDAEELGNWDGSRYDTMAQLVAAHVVEEDVAVLFSSGRTALRYIGGQAEAVVSGGARVHIDLEDIYSMATEAFPGKNIDFVLD